MWGADIRSRTLYNFFSKKVNPDFFPDVAENLKSGGGERFRAGRFARGILDPQYETTQPKINGFMLFLHDIIPRKPSN